ncbi:hypothetical protein J7E99_03950 [Streptomyces sp. ISL-44]|uniref:hypothetical protein n=1 Tax=Streptomyces sp. ISL-44 TaxID=2819184 RepID=UPI001BEA6832|nr:hypothetical protein [Streptomyces sp. ISL-44]MBT2539879.1 hypothetical protein [Streptomyces sp. ISL-44]
MSRTGPLRTRTASRGAALLTVVLLGLAGLTAPEASAATPSGPTVAVAMGDSFISGEGGRWLGNTDRHDGSRNGTDRAWTGGSTYDPAKVYGATGAVGGCHRSDVSEVAAAPLPGVDERINLACSGAETGNVLSTAAGGQPYNGEAPQTDRLAALARTKRVKVIALSIGGNDLGFGQIIGDCAYD